MPVLNDEITTLLKSQGASLAGFADLRQLPAEDRDNHPFGISFAVALNPEIIAEIEDGPTRRYYDEYEEKNRILHEIGESLAKNISDMGCHARNLTPTYDDDPVTLATKLPHKTVATLAGIGWIGKCALLVTRKFGSAIRISTVLTDAPLETGHPEKVSYCGDCSACVDICPAGAMTGNNWEVGAPRESIYDAFACRDMARELCLQNVGISNTICGRCIVACPWTQQYLKKAGI